MQQHVVRTAIIDAPIERVWAVLRDFNSHDQWHPAVATSRIEGAERSDQVGCVRNFELADGHHIRERLLTLSDTEHRSTYCIVEASVPLRRYVATLALKPVTDGNRTFWHWESSFDTPPGQERALRDMVGTGVYEAGFEGLRTFLRQGGDLRVSAAPAGDRTRRQAPLPSALPVQARCAQLQRYGDAEVLVAAEMQVRAPGPGEVRIRQRAIGVNYFDVYLRKGWMPALLPLPGVPGMEAAGSVLDVGEGVTGLRPGDRVAYLSAQPGAYCSVRCLPADQVLRLPAAVDDEVAAALLLKGLTADMLLRDLGRVQAGTKLLVHAAAGGVGQLVCAWARSLGATVIGTVSSDDKAAVARAHGCEHVIVTADYRFADTVQQRFGGVDVLVDGLGDAAWEQNFAALARCGHWISLGQASGPLKPISPELLVAKSLSFSRPVVFDFVAEPAQRQARAERVWAALAQGIIQPPSIERYSLQAAAQAHARLESRRSVGSIVLIT